jgi:hypothetical protein
MLEAGTWSNVSHLAAKLDPWFAFVELCSFLKVIALGLKIEIRAQHTGRDH